MHTIKVLLLLFVIAFAIAFIIKALLNWEDEIVLIITFILTFSAFGAAALLNSIFQRLKSNV